MRKVLIIAGLMALWVVAFYIVAGIANASHWPDQVEIVAGALIGCGAANTPLVAWELLR